MSDKQRGDTLVEVLLAMVILSIIIVGAYAIMTRGVAATQSALEHTQVRMQLNGQAEMLTYMRDSYIKAKGLNSVATTPAAAQWQSLINDPSLVNQNPVSDSSTTCSPQKNAFYISKMFSTDVAHDTALAYKKYTQVAGSLPDTYSQVDDNGVSQGLWIEAVSSTDANPSFIDFIIEACWAPNGSGALQHTSTLVRLYDAR